MHESPLVSVVIATYKRALLVPCAIRSVLNQTYKNVEIIVVDDASPDNTEETVRNIGDSRVRYLRHDKNRGLPAGRNTGIRASRGEYIAFLDDDDEWVESKVEKQLVAIQGYDAVLCGALINGTRIKCHNKHIVTQEDLLKGNEFDPSSLMARATVFNEFQFDEELRQGEDWDAFIRLAERGPIGYLSDPLLVYNDSGHQRMTNEAMNLSVSDLEKRMPVLYKHRDFFGSFWFKFHVASVLLSYLWFRDRKFEQVTYAIRRCGAGAVTAVLVRKIKLFAKKYIPAV